MIELTPLPLLPGFCYLHLVADTGRQRAVQALGPNPTVASVQSHLSRFPGDYAPGFFHAQLGTQYGLTLNHVKHISVTPGLRENTRLTAKSLLTALPGEWTVGGADELSEVIAPKPAASSPLPMSLLGSVNTSTQRVVTASLSGNTTGAELGSPTLRSVDSTSVALLSGIAAPWSYVTLSDLTVTLTPTPESAKYYISLYYCWTYEGDTPPQTIERVLTLPNSGHVVLAPPVPGGFWQPVQLHCPFGNDGINSVLKPKVPIGGPPVFHSYTKFTPLPGQTFQPKQVGFEIFFSTRVHIGSLG